MAIALPDWPAPAHMTPRLVTGRAELRPAWGGDVQRLNRPGSRYAIDVQLPPQRYAKAQDWGDIDDEEATVTMLIVQPGLDVGAPGSPLVKGAGQAGSVLTIDGLTPHYVLKKRQWLTVTISGRIYAYRVASETMADSTGEADVPLQTMLRRSPTDNAAVEIAAPRIEGFATVPEGAWATDTAGLVSLAFTIEERG
ncbi:MAG: hypothetical protein EON90_02050 [Brevundimonas sp.]|nr:MAG: hypothetical protein EON90_02050 [Brevundimonas sp.]